MANEQLLPLLLTLDGQESAEYYFYDLLEDRYKTNFLPFLSGKSVVCSAYGWLVLVEKDTGESCLWNPTSMERIQLPESEGLSPYNKCFLSKPPTEPDCFVVLNQFSSMHMCKFGDDAFVEIHCEDEGYYVEDMVYFKGVTYALIQRLDKLDNYEFVTIHMVGGTLETRPLLIDDKLSWKVPRPLQSSKSNVIYLMESPCGNELLLVSLHIFYVQFNSCFHFRVFRVDVGEMECEELENLDGQTIFLSFYGNGFCRSSDAFGASIRSNSIYYTNRNGLVVYVYDMDDRSTTSFLPRTDVDYNEATSESYWVDLPAIPDSPGFE